MDTKSERFGDLLDRIPLTATQRVMAEAQMRRAEFFADMMVRALAALTAAVSALRPQLRAKSTHRLGPTG